jgi:hypothetical protein
MQADSMASPFPGMDPWLEDFWRDVHASLVIYARDQLQGRLPTDLRARVEERVVVEPMDERSRSVYPDVRVVERGHGPALAVAVQSDVAVEEPLVLRVASEPMMETFLQIIDVGSGKQVVTVLEVLSLANKSPGDSRNQYRQKRKEPLAGGVSLVEIDLLRAGAWSMSLARDFIPPTYRTTYRVVVRRGWRRDTVEIYRVPLRQRLPVVRIPLRETDADVPLDLQALIDQCYRNGGYDDDLDYAGGPNCPLAPDDARWADELLRTQGRR